MSPYTTLTLSHLSDPHFGTDHPTVTMALLAQLHTLSPDGVVITGDITQRATPSQFATARSFVAALAPIPVMVLPGNHDIPLINLLARVLRPYDHYEHAFGSAQGFDAHMKFARLLGVNSVVRLRHINGRLDLSALARTLTNASTSTFTVLALHHPLDCRQHIDEANILTNAKAASRLFSSAHIDLVLGGHIHDPWFSTSSSRYPNNAWSWVVAVAGTCVSTRTRSGAPNSFNLVRLHAAPQVAMELQRWDNQGPGFVLVQSRWFARDALSGWHGIRQTPFAPDGPDDAARHV